jgi:Lon protease-like protein
MQETPQGGYRRHAREQWISPMEMPLFPLGVVLFPGMMLPLHIFEPRYREMINRCIDEELPFGVVLIKEGKEVGGTAEPYQIGTAARITRVDRKPDGRMDIVAVGTRRFRIEALHHNHAYLTASVSHYPVVNGDTRLAVEQVHKVRPKIMRYVDLLTKATGVQLQLDQLPEDPTSLAFLTAIALQVKPQDKQRLLALAGIPEMLQLGNFLLGREIQLLQHMIDTQSVVESLSSGPTGHLFAN